MAAAAAELPVKMNEVHAVTTPAVNRQPAALTNDRSGVSVIMSSAIITGAHAPFCLELTPRAPAAAVALRLARKSRRAARRASPARGAHATTRTRPTGDSKGAAETMLQRGRVEYEAENTR